MVLALALDDLELLAESVGSVNKGLDLVLHLDKSLWLLFLAFIDVNIVTFDTTVFIEVKDGLEPVLQLLAVAEAKGQVDLTGQIGFFLFLVYLDFAHVVLVALDLEAVDFVAGLLETLGNGNLGNLNELDALVQFCFELIYVQC